MGKTKCGAKLQAMAKKFLEAEGKESAASWSLAVMAAEMRGQFPKRAKKGQYSWMQFCKDQLHRHPGRVADRIRAVEYLDKVEGKGWRKKLETMPPWYLVCELESREDSPVKKALHKELMKGLYESIADYRAKLADLAEREELDKAPAERKTKRSKPSPKGGKRGPSGQSLEPEEAATLIVEQFEDAVRVIQAAEDWEDIDDLGLDLSEKLSANGASIRTRGAIIIIKPTKGAK